MFDKNKPYNQLPLLPPKKDIETKLLLKKAIKANTALANLKGSGKNIPNQAVLIHSIGLEEAKFSSEIENVVTTNDKLYKSFSIDSRGIDPSTKEVLHYQDALWKGYIGRCQERCRFFYEALSACSFGSHLLPGLSSTILERDQFLVTVDQRFGCFTRAA